MTLGPSVDVQHDIRNQIGGSVGKFVDAGLCQFASTLRDLVKGQHHGDGRRSFLVAALDDTFPGIGSQTHRLLEPLDPGFLEKLICPQVFIENRSIAEHRR